MKAKGVKTSIVTTITTWRSKRLSRQSNVHIDYVCTAKEARAVKPNPQSFTAVISKFRIQARQAMMVGDYVRTDIEPAKELGFRAVLLCRIEKTPCKTADHVVSSLTELPDLL